MTVSLDAHNMSSRLSPMWKSLFVVAALASRSAVAAPQYLHCPIDGRPTAMGFSFLLDREAAKISGVFGGKATEMPPLVVTSIAYISTLRAPDGTLVSELTIDRFTMRFAYYLLGFEGKPEVLVGQCATVAKQL